MKETFQFTSHVGDIVLLPNGTPGIISSTDILCGGHAKEVVVHPFTHWLHRLYLALTTKTRFYDDAINKLTLINQAKEVRP